MKKVILIYILVIGYQAIINAQFDSIYSKRIEIRKSFENYLEKEKPASFGLTIPTGDKNHYLINGAIAYKISHMASNSVNNMNIFMLYNKNNQIKKEQNLFKAGLSLENKIRITSKLKFVTTLTASYANNIKDTTQSFLGLFYFNPYYPFNNWLRLGYPVSNYKNSVMVPVFNIIPGLEYQNKYQTPQKDNSGSIARYYISSSLSLYFRIRKISGDKSSDLVNLFGTSFNYVLRKDFYNNTKIKEGYLPIYNFTISCYPFKVDNISFEASYFNGSDPVNGLDKQEYWELTFKIKK